MNGWGSGGRKGKEGERKELTGMDDRGLGRVVHGLHLRDVGDVAAHAGGTDEAARQVVLERPPVDRGALPALPPPVERGRARAVEGPVDVDLHHLLHRLDAAVDKRALLPGDARVGDEDVEPAAELPDDLVHRRLHRLPGRHIDLVRLACSAPATAFCSVRGAPYGDCKS